MRAAMFYGPGELRLEDVASTEPAPGEVLVEVKAAATCGTDLKSYRRGHPKLFPTLPSRFGHEFAGVIAEASMLSVTSKVLASNCRVATFTLRVSCGCFCSIRLCGARGFSKLRSLMYWPCKVSGLAGAGCGGGVGAEDGGIDMRAAVPCTAGLHKTRAGRGLRQLPSGGARAMIKPMNHGRLRPLIGVSACLKENGRGWVHSVGDKYVQAAIRAVGGLPVIIPAIEAFRSRVAALSPGAAMSCPIAA